MYSFFDRIFYRVAFPKLEELVHSIDFVREKEVTCKCRVPIFILSCQIAWNIASILTRAIINKVDLCKQSSTLCHFSPGASSAILASSFVSLTERILIEEDFAVHRDLVNIVNII